MAITVSIPDNDDLVFPNALDVATARRILVTMGFTQVEGATAEVDDEGNITFARQAGGAKA
jgi:hypothetical protein